MYQKELSITEISFQSGFSSIDYFSAAFTKRYKVSPSGFRKTLGPPDQILRQAQE
jgi:AraC-like DNA-binding protein